LGIEAQKKKLGKKKDAVFAGCAPTPRKRGFLKKAPFETEKHKHPPLPCF